MTRAIIFISGSVTLVCGLIRPDMLFIATGLALVFVSTLQNQPGRSEDAP